MLKGCDLLILPTTPDVVSLEPMLETARALGEASYRALLTIVPSKPSREGEAMGDDLRENSVPIFEAMIRRAAGFQKAALAGIPIKAMTGRDRLSWLDYEAVGKEIMEILGNA